MNSLKLYIAGDESFCEKLLKVMGDLEEEYEVSACTAKALLPLKKRKDTVNSSGLCKELKLKKDKCDFIIVDCNSAFESDILKRLQNGVYETAELIKQIRLFTWKPVFVMSISDSEDEFKAYFNAGADYVISSEESLTKLAYAIFGAFRMLENYGCKKIKSSNFKTLKAKNEKNILSKDLMNRVKEIDLTRTEAKVFNVLLNNLNDVVPKETIISEVWGRKTLKEYMNGDKSRKLDTLLKQIRKKAANTEFIIKNKYGVGYGLFIKE